MITLAYEYNEGGLNNQKLALLGLFLRACSSGQPLALPSFYNLDHAGGARDVVPFGTVYDRDRFVSMLETFGVEVVAADPAPGSRGWEFFGLGAEHIALEVAAHRIGPDSPTCVFFRSLVPVLRNDPRTAPLRYWLRAREPESTVVQMRIETDWQLFSAITLKPTVGSTEDYLPHFGEIIAKVVNTFGFDLGEVYVVCDEASLPVPREEIRRVSREVFGVSLRWKSDLLLPHFLEGLSVIERSILDFDMALSADRFVGLTRSTFSNLATFERYCMTGAPVRRHYIYNIPGPKVLERHDNGAYAFADAAVRLAE